MSWSMVAFISRRAWPLMWSSSSPQLRKSRRLTSSRMSSPGPWPQDGPANTARATLARATRKRGRIKTSRRGLRRQLHLRLGLRLPDTPIVADEVRGHHQAEPWPRRPGLEDDGLAERQAAAGAQRPRPVLVGRRGDRVREGQLLLLDHLLV